MRRRPPGFTLLELLIIIGLVAVVGLAGLLELRGRRSRVEFAGTVERMVAVLRDAQTKAAAQADGSAWGVRFDNASSGSPFYALFRSPYASGTVISRLTLPSSVLYASSSIPVGNAVEVVFSALTGAPAAAANITVVSGSASSTITVSVQGAVSF